MDGWTDGWMIGQIVGWITILNEKSKMNIIIILSHAIFFRKYSTTDVVFLTVQGDSSL